MKSTATNPTISSSAAFEPFAAVACTAAAAGCSAAPRGAAGGGGGLCAEGVEGSFFPTIVAAMSHDASSSFRPASLMPMTAPHLGQKA